MTDLARARPDWSKPSDKVLSSDAPGMLGIHELLSSSPVRGVMVVASWGYTGFGWSDISLRLTRCDMAARLLPKAEGFAARRKKGLRKGLMAAFGLFEPLWPCWRLEGHSIICVGWCPLVLCLLAFTLTLGRNLEIPIQFRQNLRLLSLSTVKEDHGTPRSAQRGLPRPTESKVSASRLLHRHNPS